MSTLNSAEFTTVAKGRVGERIAADILVKEDYFGWQLEWMQKDISILERATVPLVCNSEFSEKMHVELSTFLSPKEYLILTSIRAFDFFIMHTTSVDYELLNKVKKYHQSYIKIAQRYHSYLYQSDTNEEGLPDDIDYNKLFQVEKITNPMSPPSRIIYQSKKINNRLDKKIIKKFETDLINTNEKIEEILKKFDRILLDVKTTGKTKFHSNYNKPNKFYLKWAFEQNFQVKILQIKLRPEFSYRIKDLDKDIVSTEKWRFRDLRNYNKIIRILENLTRNKNYKSLSDAKKLTLIKSKLIKNEIPPSTDIVTHVKNLSEINWKKCFRYRPR